MKTTCFLAAPMSTQKPLSELEQLRADKARLLKLVGFVEDRIARLTSLKRPAVNF
jgi:hypothetical protein